MRLVLVESPFAGPTPADRAQNITYARRALHDCFRRDEAPFASHLLYTQPGVLNDDLPAERQQGIDAGLLWGALAAATVVYVDRGVSNGMRYGIMRALRVGREVEIRALDLTFERQREIRIHWVKKIVQLRATPPVRDDAMAEKLVRELADVVAGPS